MKFVDIVWKHFPFILTVAVNFAEYYINFRWICFALLSILRVKVVDESEWVWDDCGCEYDKDGKVRMLSLRKENADLWKF
jgi:hypothetical protein